MQTPEGEVPRKFQMLYTCNICDGRNLITVRWLGFLWIDRRRMDAGERGLCMHAFLILDPHPPHARTHAQVDRIAFTEGIVVAKCKHCDAKHLVADNLSKLDFGKGKVSLVGCAYMAPLVCLS